MLISNEVGHPGSLRLTPIDDEWAIFWGNWKPEIWHVCNIQDTDWTLAAHFMVKDYVALCRHCTKEIPKIVINWWKLSYLSYAK